MKVILAYIPVWHAGYQLFIDAGLQSFRDETPKASAPVQLLIVDPAWAQTLDPSLDYLRKEIRAVQPEQMQRLIQALYPDLEVKILNQTTLAQVSQAAQTNQSTRSTPAASATQTTIIAANEDVSKVVITQFFPTATTTYSPVFLRWDRDAALTNQPLTNTTTTAISEVTKTFFTQAYQAADGSSDWWRHVGAVLTAGDQVLFAAGNTHQPTNHTPYIVGDLRQLFHKKEFLEYSTAIHAEAAVIAQAAAQGVSTQGASLYVTTFPCPYCARIVAQAGIAQLFVADSYATLDGHQLLESAGVEILQVAIDEQSKATAQKSSRGRTYPTS